LDYKDEAFKLVGETLTVPATSPNVPLLSIHRAILLSKGPAVGAGDSLRSLKVPGH